jgi:hypothetical protein
MSVLADPNRAACPCRATLMERPADSFTGSEEANSHLPMTPCLTRQCRMNFDTALPLIKQDKRCADGFDAFPIHVQPALYL